MAERKPSWLKRLFGKSEETSAKTEEVAVETAKPVSVEREAEKKSIDKNDISTWTYGYVRDNENQCSEIALKALSVSTEKLKKRDYAGAAKGFAEVVTALELLQRISEDYYQGPLYANCFALAKIYIFGLKDKASASTYAEKACRYAEKSENRGSSSASRDLRTIKSFYDDLKQGGSMRDFEREFPGDILAGI